MTPVADPGFTGARIAAPQAPRGGVMGGATGGVGGQCPPPLLGPGVTGGTGGRFNENDLCNTIHYNTADSLYSVQVFLNMTYILSFALHRYNFQCLALH